MWKPCYDGSFAPQLCIYLDSAGLLARDLLWFMSLFWILSHASSFLKLALLPVALGPVSYMPLFTAGLDQSGTPLILLAPSGRVEHVVEAAYVMMRQSPVLQIRDSRLHLRRAEERNVLRDALTDLQSDTMGPIDNTRLVVLRNREERAVMALLLGLVCHPMLPRLIIVRIANLLAQVEAPATLLARVFGFTPTEARVSMGLLDGLDLKTIAKREHAALETIRGHVKRAMAKTTAHSQAQFVRLLLHVHASLASPSRKMIITEAKLPARVG